MFLCTPAKTEFLAALLKLKTSVRELQSTKKIHQHFHYMWVCFIYRDNFCALGYMVSLTIVHYQVTSGQAPGFECPSSCSLIAVVLCFYCSRSTESCKHFSPTTLTLPVMKNDRFWLVYCLCQSYQICSSLRIC